MRKNSPSSNPNTVTSETEDFIAANVMIMEKINQLRRRKENISNDVM